jgi:hypothetical protein
MFYLVEALASRFFFKLLKARKSKKINFLATKGIKIQDFFWMKKPNVNHGL